MAPGFTVLAFIKAKPGMSPEEFRTHYETKHTALAKRLGVAPPHYRRLYLQKDHPLNRDVDER